MTTVTAQQLFDRCADSISSYPAGTCALPSGYPVFGRGFFPAASGSFDEGRLDTPITSRKIMFVGQDWGAEASLRELIGNPDADMKSSTATNLCELLKDAEIRKEECFFTNALFGVRAYGPNTGVSPGWKSLWFLEQCAFALRTQIEAIRPRAMICLGRHAPTLLAILYPECKVWCSATGFKQIDRGGHAVLRLNSPMGPILAAILLHPSYRKVNGKHRCYQGATGHDAEVRILRSVWTQAMETPVRTDIPDG